VVREMPAAVSASRRKIVGTSAAKRTAGVAENCDQTRAGKFPIQPNECNERAIATLPAHLCGSRAGRSDRHSTGQARYLFVSATSLDPSRQILEEALRKRSSRGSWLSSDPPTSSRIWSFGIASAALAIRRGVVELEPSVSRLPQADSAYVRRAVGALGAARAAAGGGDHSVVQYATTAAAQDGHLNDRLRQHLLWISPAKLREAIYGSSSGKSTQTSLNRCRVVKDPDFRRAARPQNETP